MATLAAPRAMVLVGPPLSGSGKSFGSLLAKPGQVRSVAGKLMLLRPLVAPAPQFLPVLAAMIVAVTVRVAPKPL